MFTWDPEKSKNNKKKHGFSFDDVLDVFNDPNLVDWADWVHSTMEET